jgi:predicted RNA-binding Zn ribbon-like protein
MTVTLTVEPCDDACLAYANTLSWRGRAAPLEELRDVGDLVRWVAGSAGLGPEVVGAWESWARPHPAAGAALFAEAIALREAIYRIFRALACGEAIPDPDLAALNRALAAAPPRRRLAPRAAGYGWQIGPAKNSAPTLLAPVLWSAGDLLASDRRRRVRLCANAQCLWLFLDESKAGTRRWCDMASCGNRAKARRHYQRTRPGAAPSLGPAPAPAAGCPSRARS